MPDKPTLIIARFDKSLHDRSGFSSGHTRIDNFFRSSLSDQIRDGMIVAWVATLAGERDVLGFYTLSAMAVRRDQGLRNRQRAAVHDIPVIYIRAVAVRLDWQGKGIGTSLVVDALRRCLLVSVEMGAAAVVLDVLEDEHLERRKQFYFRLGFRPLGDPDNPNRVFIPMADIRASLS